MSAARFHEDIIETATDAGEIPHEESGDELSQVIALSHELTESIRFRENGAGASRLENEVRMNDDARQAFRHGQSDESILRREREAAHQHGSDVVAVVPAARRRFAFDRERIE